mmetsp:Transcript_56262/g.150351  ORF Transcript_56262/g.150351 Transcript_56262/m.150351 type:complete len:614 (-) Transcript_56262:78-1919(-)
MEEAPLEEFFVGSFRSWKDPWGFLVCPDHFAGDVFAHREHFVEGVPPFEIVGCPARFRVSTDEKGRVHATEILILQDGTEKGKGFTGCCPAPMGLTQAVVPRLLPKQMNVVGKGHMPGVLNPALSPAVPNALVRQLPQLAGTRMRGEIRSWKDPWGFIISAKFVGDLFVHRQNMQILGEPTPGKQVSFTVAVDQKGRCTAADVTEPSSAAEDFIGQGLLTGYVRSWRKDWGFIVAPEFFEGDLFCHQQRVQLDGLSPDTIDLVNRAVTFEVVKDERGRMCANSVVPGDLLVAQSSIGLGGQGALSGHGGVLCCKGSPAPEPAVNGIGGPPPSGAALAQIGFDEVLTGTIRSYKDAWGYIICPQRFEGDLFVHRDSFVHVLPPCIVGFVVQFQYSVDQRGRPHATNVQLLGPPESPAPVQGLQSFVKQDLQQPSEVLVSPEVAAKAGALVGHQFAGVVRSWKDAWGFLIAPDCFEGDIFAHKDQLSGTDELTPGAQVTFYVELDQRGRLTAAHVQCTSTAADWAGTGAVLTGVLRSWKEQWGFIAAPGSFAGDLFCHIGNVAMPPETIVVGMPVVFKIDVNQQGRVTALEVNPAPSLKRRVIPSQDVVKRQRTA